MCYFRLLTARTCIKRHLGQLMNISLNMPEPTNKIKMFGTDMRTVHVSQLDLEDIERIALSGFYVALRVGYAFPVEEINRLPEDWVQHHTKNRLMVFDPVVRWVYANTGVTRWSDISDEDPRGVLKQAQTFGLRYGVAIAVYDGNEQGQRSYGYFARPDREFDELEISSLRAFLVRRHAEMAPPTNLTKAEVDALKLVKEGMRLKEVAHTLGVSEGAIKQRIRNAKAKLNANTSSQAATIAAQHGLI